MSFAVLQWPRATFTCYYYGNSHMTKFTITVITTDYFGHSEYDYYCHILSDYCLQSSWSWRLYYSVIPILFWSDSRARNRHSQNTRKLRFFSNRFSTIVDNKIKITQKCRVQYVGGAGKDYKLYISCLKSSVNCLCSNCWGAAHWKDWKALFEAVDLLLEISWRVLLGFEWLNHW